jgi:hypothetical protein
MQSKHPMARKKLLLISKTKKYTFKVRVFFYFAILRQRGQMGLLNNDTVVYIIKG